MKGYVYLNVDGELGVRLHDFIETEDPGFWERNAHMIDTVWKFDSEDEESITRILTSFRHRQLKAEQVRLFCQQIGFDLQTFLSKFQKGPTSFTTETK